MTETRYTCDGCGRDAAETLAIGWAEVEIRIRPLRGGGEPRSADVDLCATCLRDAKVPGVDTPKEEDE